MDANDEALLLREDLREVLKEMPRQPGVYLMKDRAGQVLYIGKANNLRSRVRSYFGAACADRPAVEVFRKRVFAVETVVTDSEKAALFLENILVKKHQPRYNVKLRDDKTFLGVRLSVKDAVPRLSPVRRPKKDGAAYFGPFHSALALRKVIRLIQKVFGVRVCSDSFFRNRTRPCLEHQIGRCLAPCVAGYVSAEAYEQAVAETVRFLRGRGDEVMKTIQEKMADAAAREDYEAAIRYRDQIEAIETTLQDQVVASHRRADDHDVVGFHCQEGFTHVYVLFVRQGQVAGGAGFALGNVFGTPGEILTSFLLQRYEGSEHAYRRPAKILLPVGVENASLLAEALGLQLTFPKRGESKKLLEMATDNACVHFEDSREKSARAAQALEELTRKLYLPAVPERIECVDISNFQGREAVGSLVLFRGTEPDKSGYRHYKIKTVFGSNDYEMMAEVLRRRFQSNTPRPDLLIVDGGKGQLQIANAILGELGVKGLSLAALAKARTLPDEAGSTEERIFLPGRTNPVTFRRGSGALFLLERIRDEAHRFAITYHRKLRKRATIKSILDEIVGIGPARRKKLLETFGSVEGMRQASLAELQARGGLSEDLAQEVHRKLVGSPM